MPFTTQNGLRCYTFDIFPKGIIQAVFTRQGGVSPEPWDSLNVGGAIGDDPARVHENRLRSFAALDRPPGSIFDVWQVHSANVAFSDTPRSPGTPYNQADVILTDRPDVTLFMRFADCVPIFLHDPRNCVVGLAHAGWLGTVRLAVAAAIQSMQERYGSQPADILAGIGPSIGPDHYEIGSDVIDQVKRSFPGDAAGLLAEREDGVYFDLWSANRLLLERCGIHQIEISHICTACHTEDWFSHRAYKGRTGRFGAMMALSL